MKSLLILMLILAANVMAKITFSDYFENKTMRVDYFHTGIASEEIFSLDQVYEEGLWPGTQTRLTAPVDAGLYRFEIFDTGSQTLIFAQGYNSIFGEWQTTSEALEGVYRTMHETVRFPMPHEPIKLVISKRDRSNEFQSIWSTEIDPASRFVSREQKRFPFKTTKFIDNGDPRNKVDLLLIGDGYTSDELEKFRNDVSRYSRVLFESVPFNTRKSDFNVWTIEASSQDSGIDQPRQNQWRRTTLGCSFNTFDLSRYVLSLHNKDIRDISSLAPYDAIYILFNQARYGGGGIYNCMATCYTGTPENQPDWWSDYVFVHEFGHSFAGLADEYYSSDVSYNDMYPVDIEPWEPNITTLNMNGQAKWTNQIATRISKPTFWNKAAYDSLSTERQKAGSDEDARKAVDKQMTDLLADTELQGVIGCFEGGGYASKGVYRPSLNCRMFSKSLVEFCPICRQALEDMIGYYTK